jgi:hypothetical protein
MPDVVGNTQAAPSRGTHLNQRLFGSAKHHDRADGEQSYTRSTERPSEMQAGAQLAGSSAG